MCLEADKYKNIVTEGKEDGPLARLFQGFTEKIIGIVAANVGLAAFLGKTKIEIPLGEPFKVDIEFFTSAGCSIDKSVGRYLEKQGFKNVEVYIERERYSSTTGLRLSWD